MALKPLRWLGNARAAVRAFPPNARRDAGYQLYRVQELDVDLARTRLKELLRQRRQT